VDYGTQGEDNVPMYFCADGEVIESGLHAQFGNYFFYYVAGVDRTFVYFHARDAAPSKGMYKAGVQCGIVGQTGLAYGIHLHLECLKGKKTSADRRALFTSFEALQLAAEDGDAFIRSRLH
jgi:murein DD-endopeptidase MepM/ murein hydrolase activator NlpD